jgi:hypothetical protein
LYSIVYHEYVRTAIPATRQPAKSRGRPHLKRPKCGMQYNAARHPMTGAGRERRNGSNSVRARLVAIVVALSDFAMYLLSPQGHASLKTFGFIPVTLPVAE